MLMTLKSIIGSCGKSIIFLFLLLKTAQRYNYSSACANAFTTFGTKNHILSASAVSLADNLADDGRKNGKKASGTKFALNMTCNGAEILKTGTKEK